MSRTRKNSKTLGGQPTVPSAVARASRLRRGAGVHADQMRRADPKQLRRDKTYKSDWR